MPTADSYERLANKLVALQKKPQKRQPRPTPQPVAPTRKPATPQGEPPNQTKTTPKPSPLDALARNYLRSTPQVAQAAAENWANIFNPFPQATKAYGEGRHPTKAEWGTDAAFLAAGAIPFGKIGTTAARLGGRVGPKAIETLATQNKRVEDLSKLLNQQGPAAINEFLSFPRTGYSNYLFAPELRKFFKETDEIIPRGQELYRAPASDEVLQDTWLSMPREVGQWWRPGAVKSAAGSSDLQRLGGVASGTNITGGGQSYAPGFARINAREDLPGIVDINEFLNRYVGQPGHRGRPIAGTSEFNAESVLGPATQYLLKRFDPAVGSTPPTWYFDAYRGR